MQTKRHQSKRSNKLYSSSSNDFWPQKTQYNKIIEIILDIDI